MTYIPPKRKHLTQAERKIVYDKCSGHCAYCGKEISEKEMQADHVIPMDFYKSYKAYGEDIDCIANMLPSCRSCNHYKSTLTLERFRTAIENFTAVLLRDSVTYKNAVRFGMVIQNPHPIVFYFEKESEVEK